MHLNPCGRNLKSVNSLYSWLKCQKELETCQLLLKWASYTSAMAEICKCVLQFANMCGDWSVCLSSCTAYIPPVGGT